MIKPITREESYLSKLAGMETKIPDKPITRKEMYLSRLCLKEGAIPERPITREEVYLAKLCGESVTLPSPITRLEKFMSAAAGVSVVKPTPITREEYLWDKYKTSVIYGYHVNPSIDDPAACITYLADAKRMTPCGMDFTKNKFNWGSWKKAFFMPRPCMVKFDGTVDYYLDPDDYSKKEDGTASDVSDENYGGNAMMEWPLIWFKIVPGEADGEADVYISNEQADEDYHCWSNVNSKNEIIDHFYTAIYQGTGTAKLRSLSGVALTQANGNGNTTVTEEVTRATANNTTADVEWYTETYSDYTLICMLLTLISKSLDSEVFGRGIDTGEQTEKEEYITGALDNAGMFYGTNTGTGPVKTFGMENFWGLAWHRVAGFVTVSDVESRIKWTYGTADGTTASAYNQNGSGYLVGPQLPHTNGYVKTMAYGSIGIVPRTLGASTEKYYCNYFYQNSGTRYLLCGGRSGGGQYGGRWSRGASRAASARHWGIGASLSLKPLRRG